MDGLFQPPTQQETIKKLFQLGYFEGQEWDTVRNFLLSTPSVEKAVEEYAWFNEVPQDEVATHLLQPRCGLPDLVRDPQEAALSKWRMLDVTASNRLSGLNPLSAEMEQAAWIEALAAWSAVCGIRMKYIEDMSVANIYANPGSTGAGVLAYSYLPNNSGPGDQLEQVYNRSTNWSYQLLIQVMIHELGHAIGLDHGPKGSIMKPTAGGDILRPQAWDIAEVVKRYGQPQAKPVPPPVPNPQPPDCIILSPLVPGRYKLVPVANVNDDLNMG